VRRSVYQISIVSPIAISIVLGIFMTSESPDVADMQSSRCFGVAADIIFKPGQRAFGGRVFDAEQPLMRSALTTFAHPLAVEFEQIVGDLGFRFRTGIRRLKRDRAVIEIVRILFLIERNIAEFQTGGNIPFSFACKLGKTPSISIAFSKSLKLISTAFNPKYELPHI